MEHRNQTDQSKQIKLPSQIERVAWTTRRAMNGALVGLEILTHFVGNRSELEIELSDQSGKSFGKFMEMLSGNRFWTKIKVPSEAKQALYADVKLPKNSLQMKSGPMIILPTIEMTNLKWDRKEARRGDILKLTADIKDVADGTEGEISIWEYDSDGAHDFITNIPVLVRDKKVEAEWEYEYHDDTDDIPTQEESENEYNPPEFFFRVNIGGVSADSRRLEFKDWIKISLHDEQGRPIANEDYRLVFADGTEKRGRLGSEGMIEIKDAPPGRIAVEFPNKPLVEITGKKRKST